MEKERSIMCLKRNIKYNSAIKKYCVILQTLVMKRRFFWYAFIFFKILMYILSQEADYVASSL